MHVVRLATALRIIFVAIMVLASACQPAEPELSSNQGEVRADWLVVEINGTQARELGVIVSFDDGTVDTVNVCNRFTASYGFADTFMQRLPGNTTVTYGGVGCVTGDDVDGQLRSLLYFNANATSVTINDGRL